MAHHTLSIKSRQQAAGSRQPCAPLSARCPLPAARSSTRAFTLAESLTASVILAIAVLGVTNAIVAAQQQLDAQEEDTTAIALCRQLMEEAASLPLSSTDATAGWPSVTDRTLFDTIGDYNGYADRVAVPIYRSNRLADTGTFSSAAPAATPITGAAPTTARQAYIRRMSVAYPTSIFGQTVTSGDFAVVVVNVIGGGGANVKLTRIIARNTITR